MAQSTITTEIDISNQIRGIKLKGRKLYFATDMFSNIECFVDKIMAELWRTDVITDIAEVEDLCYYNTVENVWRLRKKYQSLPYRSLYKIIKGVYPEKATTDELIVKALVKKGVIKK